MAAVQKDWKTLGKAALHADSVVQQTAIYETYRLYRRGDHEEAWDVLEYLSKSVGWVKFLSIPLPKKVPAVSAFALSGLIYVRHQDEEGVSKRLGRVWTRIITRSAFPRWPKWLARWSRRRTLFRWLVPLVLQALRDLPGSAVIEEDLSAAFVPDAQYSISEVLPPLLQRLTPGNRDRENVDWPLLEVDVRRVVRRNNLVADWVLEWVLMRACARAPSEGSEFLRRLAQEIVPGPGRMEIFIWGASRKSAGVWRDKREA